MKLKIVTAVVMLVLVVSGTVLLNSRSRRLDIVMRIEYRQNDAVPYLLEVDRQGNIYALEKERAGLFVRAYGSDREQLWREPVPVISGLEFDAVIVFLPGQEPICRVMKMKESDSRVLRVVVEDGGAVKGHMHHYGEAGLTWPRPIVADAGHVYVVGDDNLDDMKPTLMMAVSNSRKTIWRTHTDGITRGVADSQGDLIVAGSVGAGVGPFVAKYSEKGKPIWYWAAGEQDGGGSIWVDTDKRNTIYCIGSQHEGIMASSGDDVSGRGQDVSLFRLSPEGRLLSKTLISHGLWLSVSGAVVNDKGEVIVVGNRCKTAILGYRRGWEDTAQLIKCDARGGTVWSRVIPLPSGGVATDVRVDARGNIYVLGSGEKPDGIKAFVYKVRNPQ